MKNFFRASRCWLQLALRASCKINFICTLSALLGFKLTHLQPDPHCKDKREKQHKLHMNR